MRFLSPNVPSLLVIAAFSLLGTALHAASPSDQALAPDLIQPAAPASSDGSVYDRMWGLATLHKQETGFFNEFSFQGRLQLQFADGDSDSGHFDSGDRPHQFTWGDAEVRRWRLGAKTKWLNGRLRLDGQIDINPDIDAFYRDIYDLYLDYKVSDALSIGVGKTKANVFTLEQSTSSKEILTFERSLLSNTLFAGELTGVWAYGKVDNKWLYKVAAFAGDQRREFSSFNRGAVYNASLGYDLAETLKADKAIVRLDYQHSTKLSNGDVYNVDVRRSPSTQIGGARFDDALALNEVWEKGRWALSSEVLGAMGRGAQGNIWGFMVMPSVYIADGLQLVVQYQHAQGDQDSIQLASRYERLAPDLLDRGRGDEYDNIYLGLNYYIYGHKLKLMAGVDYTHLDGGAGGGSFNGVTGLAGLRMFF